MKPEKVTIKRQKELLASYADINRSMDIIKSFGKSYITNFYFSEKHRIKDDAL